MRGVYIEHRRKKGTMEGNFDKFNKSQIDEIIRVQYNFRRNLIGKRE